MFLNTSKFSSLSYIHFFMAYADGDPDACYDVPRTAQKLRGAGATHVTTRHMKNLGHVMPKEKAVYDDMASARLIYGSG